MSLRVVDSPNQKSQWFPDSLTRESGHQLHDSLSRGVTMVSREVAIQNLADLQNFKQLNQPIKGPI
jgi:hypothetical protein